MTPLDLDALDKQHQEFVFSSGERECRWCCMDWPCPTSTLIRVVRRQEATLDLIAQSGDPWSDECVGALSDVAALVDLGEPT